MTKEEILKKISESRNNSILTEELKGTDARVQLKGVIGSSAAFINATAYQHIHKTSLVILADKEEAAYFLNDLEISSAKKMYCFFRHPIACLMNMKR